MGTPPNSMSYMGLSGQNPSAGISGLYDMGPNKPPPPMATPEQFIYYSSQIPRGMPLPPHQYLPPQSMPQQLGIQQQQGQVGLSLYICGFIVKFWQAVLILIHAVPIHIVITNSDVLRLR